MSTEDLGLSKKRVTKSGQPQSSALSPMFADLTPETYFEASVRLDFHNKRKYNRTAPDGKEKILPQRGFYL